MAQVQGQVDARATVIAALAFILAVALMPAGAYAAMAAAWLLVATAGALRGIAPLTLARRGGIVFPFVLAAIPLIFIRTDEMIWEGFVGPLSLHISGVGLRIALSALLKAWISVQASIVLVATADAPMIVVALRRMRLPDAIATSAGLTIRYLELLRDEAQRMLRARAARSVSPVGVGGERVGGSIAWRARTTGNLVGSLFLRAYARAARVEEAALSRGATGSLSSKTLPTADRHLGVKLLGTIALLLALSAFGQVVPRL